MSQYVSKQARVSALEEARSRLHERYYRATSELEEVRKNLQLIDAQLLVMTGLCDPAPEQPDADN